MLSTNLEHLMAALEQLRAALLALQITIAEDRPQRDESALVDLFGDAVTDQLGWLAEAQQIVDSARRAANDRRPPGEIWPHLITCDERLAQIEYGCFDLGSHNRMTPLVRMGRQRGGEWPAWLSSVQQGLDAVQNGLFAGRHALVACMRDLAEYSGAVMVQSTAIGQQFFGPAERWNQQAYPAVAVGQTMGTPVD
ncbi:MAG: hypothetical protein KJZ93_15595 [Caldilineaceae bacterium]|nr:hypothetical protein [Caldilineaceae bacterium]